MPLFNRRRQLPSDQFSRAEGNAMIPRWTRPPERNTYDWIKMFSKSPRLSVVERIASDLSFATGKLYVVGSDGEESEITRHSFLNFWAQPNPLHEFSAAALWRLEEIYLLLKGEGYFVIEKDPAGRPAELWPVPTHWVMMTPYLGHPYYTVKTTSGSIMEVSVDDMFVMKDINPLDPFLRGLGQAEAIADEVEIDEYAAQFQKRFFYNDATPNIIVSMPGSSDEQRKRFRAEWLERFKGVFKSHGIATTGGDISIQKVAESMKDMDMVNGRTFIRNATLEHFGVPREIMGITESSNRATSEAAQYIYAQNVLMPRLRRREEAINQQLLPMFGEGLLWRYDDIVPRNQEFDKMKGIDGWNAGLLTKDEARELLDMPPAEVGGDVYKTTFSDVYIREDDDPVAISTAAANLQYAESAPPLETGGEQDIEITDNGIPLDAENGSEGAGDGTEGIEIVSSKGTSPEERKSLQVQAAQRALLQAEREQTQRFEIATLKYLREQGRRVSDAMGGTTKDERSVWDILMGAIPGYDPNSEDAAEQSAAAWSSLSEADRTRLVSAFTLGLIDWPKEETALLNIFEPLWKESYDKGAGVSAKLYNLQAVQRPELVSTAKLRGGVRVKGITETTQQSIARIVSAGLEHGDSRATIAKQIEQEMQTTASRARTIATQECNTSLLTGHYDMMRKAGAAWKTWHVANMSAARPSHKRLNGERVPIDAKFSNGLMQPCDPDCTDPAEVVNCHCFLTFDK